jgi:hypothetical protein
MYIRLPHEMSLMQGWCLEDWLIGRCLLNWIMNLPLLHDWWPTISQDFTRHTPGIKLPQTRSLSTQRLSSRPPGASLSLPEKRCSTRLHVLFPLNNSWSIYLSGGTTTGTYICHCHKSAEATGLTKGLPIPCTFESEVRYEGAGP